MGRHRGLAEILEGPRVKNYSTVCSSRGLISDKCTTSESAALWARSGTRADLGSDWSLPPLELACDKAADRDFERIVSGSILL